MVQHVLRTRSVLLLIQVIFLLALPGAISCAGAGQNGNAVDTESAKTWVGKKAKAFTLPGIDGKPVDIAKQLGKHPVVLVFYRGVW